jgi:hypothetical protein
VKDESHWFPVRARVCQVLCQGLTGLTRLRMRNAPSREDLSAETVQSWCLSAASASGYRETRLRGRAACLKFVSTGASCKSVDSRVRSCSLLLNRDDACLVSPAHAPLARRIDECGLVLVTVERRQPSVSREPGLRLLSAWQPARGSMGDLQEKVRRFLAFCFADLYL